ncbi:uncharacterized protein LOC132948762 [Metopolophium dirhodum]|uniref:uncharacterized protein LOC132948762 n=1 Tax=Metopolophium dirhodum TaxID=44670 RepID=UPI0029900547|nr:uncharacterized protein LOC132948762 [Metopolophium dirhodum]
MNDVFIGNHVYTFIYYVSLFFGTCMTIIPKTHKIIGCTISLLWCLTIVGNQIDYVMKPWMMEDTEKTKQDMAFEKIIHFDFWTYNAICLLSCLFSLIGRKIEVTTALSPPETSTNTWRVVIVFVLFVGNIVPACFSYNFPGVQKKAGSAYNLLFQVG